MAIGKKGFGLGRLISRKDKNAAAAWSDLDDEFLSLASNAFISRPPPLDPTTEAELRDACALVLQDLKPSGHDIEDTRMKSDMLVDQETREGHRHTASKSKNKLKKTNYEQKAAAAAEAKHKPPHHKTDSVSSLATSLARLNDSKASFGSHAPHKPPSTFTDSQAYDRTQSMSSQMRPQSMTSQIRTQSMTSAAAVQIESPRAPLPTGAPESRQLTSPVSATAPTRPMFDSASTSQFSSSTNPTADASTGITSLNDTPSFGSQRASDNNYSKTDADSGAGEWMKQEVEKHIKTQDAQAAAPEHAVELPATPPVPEQPTRSRSKSFFANFRSRGKSTSTKDDRPGSGDSKKRKDSSTITDDKAPVIPEPVVDKQRLFQPTRSAGTNFSRPSSSRGPTAAAEPQVVDAAPQQQSSDPPVTLPKLDTAVALPLSRPPPTLIAAGTTSTSRPGSSADKLNSGIKDKSEEPLASPRAKLSNGDIYESETFVSASDSRPGSRTGMMSERQAAKSTVPQASGSNLQHVSYPGPEVDTQKGPLAQHSTDAGITVKDFYRPSLRANEGSAQRVPTSSSFGSRAGDGRAREPRSGDLDSLMKGLEAPHRAQSSHSFHTASGSMSSARDRPGTADSTSSRTTLPPDTIPRRTSSRSQSMLQAPPNLDSLSRDGISKQNRTYSLNAASPMSPVSIQPEPLDGRLNGWSTAHREHQRQADAEPEDDAVSLRDSTGPTSLYTNSRPNSSMKSKPKERRGFGKLFNKRNGSQKIYVSPTYYQQHIYGQPLDGEDDGFWDGEEACAAPVVGFGRGW